MVISKSRRAGFFAELTTVIRHIKKVKDENKKIHIEWDKYNSLYYDSNFGENVWEYFFEQVDITENEKIDYVLNDYIALHPIEQLTLRQTFNKIYMEYIKLNENTQRLINENVKLVDKNTLGLHIRKTDKFLCDSFNEPMALPIDDELVFKLINEKLELGYDKIFLATDCSETYNKYYEKYKNLIINIDRIRGNGVNAIHTNNQGSGYYKGLEALLDTYILSECGFLIRSTSNLSSFSMFININLECININEIYRNDIREHEFNIYSKI
jgi:hypothetical protein